MTRRRGASGLVAVLVAMLSACRVPGLSGYELDAPEVPDDYPQIEAFAGGAAELVVDGMPSATKEGSGAIYDPGGLDPDPLPASMSFDGTLFIDFASPDPGTYTAENGQLAVRWDSSEFELNASCGTGTLVIVGQGSDGGLLAESVIWGTLHVELCNPETSERLAITGRFSSTVIEA